MSMTEAPDLTPEECYKEAAAALRSENHDAAERWRLLGDSVATFANSR